MPERESNESFAARMERRMNSSLSAGMDEESALDTIRELQTALQYQAKAMAAEAKARETCPVCERVATPPQAPDIAHVTKPLDEATRLWQFAKGGPDHRSEVTSEDKSVLRCLTNEQLAQVWIWVEQNASEGAGVE